MMATREPPLDALLRLGAAGPDCAEEDVVQMYKAARAYFREQLSAKPTRRVTALLTKYNDAGPRSAPWRAVSERVPGRPQDGRDGNRINRWELPEDHKFYSTRRDGLLVGIKYMFQTLSMDGAPPSPRELSECYMWLTGHEIGRGRFRDPIQLVGVSFEEILEKPRLITSGHLHPLDRGGRHLPENTSLMLKVSNDLQGSLTVEELLDKMEEILRRHGRTSERPQSAPPEGESPLR